MPRPKRTKVASTLRRAPAPKPAERTRVPTEELSDRESNEREQIEVPDSQVYSQKPADEPKRTIRGRTSKVAATTIDNDTDNEAAGRGRARVVDSVEMNTQEAESSAQMPDITNPTNRRGTSRAFKRRPRQGSILGAGRVQRSVSVESELARDESVMLGREVMGSAFKPRRRQGSILGDAGYGRDRDSSAEPPSRPGSAMGAAPAGGLFGRRVRQGSILGTPGYGSRRESGVTSGLTDDESALAGFEYFNPDDESTPLHPQRVLPSTEPASASASAIRSAPAYTSSPNPRKRKISPNSREPEAEPSSSALPERMSLPRHHLSTASNSDSLSPPPANISSPQRNRTSGIPSATYAPPHSSSSLNITPSPPPARRTLTAATRRSARATVTPKAKTGTRRQPARGQAAVMANEDDDLPSSPPSLTHSPDNAYTSRGGAAKSATKKGKKEKIQPAMMATAELQALLPRRRVRRPVPNRDVFEIDSDGGENEDGEGSADELSVLPPARRYGRSGTITGPAPAKKVTKLKTKSRRISDKENPTASEEEEVDPDDSLAPLKDTVESEEDEDDTGARKKKKMNEKASKEIEKAKRKFASVDQWEMEFESVTAEGSSQVDAR